MKSKGIEWGRVLLGVKSLERKTSKWGQAPLMVLGFRNSEGIEVGPGSYE